ncbi:MAG: NAD-dependent epimerase/dehydratase family protein [Candidatus Omnitrophica bacterium]|nr:NAD-dependent epimerase/dehydratase family protein [Candidatus Omnitrophota bacterium]
MKVLVTGGTGFVGSALVRHLLDAQYEVKMLVRTRRNDPLFDNQNIEIVEGALSSLEDIRTAMSGCDVVFHVAADYIFYPFWEKEARDLYETNVQGTVNMLNVALENKAERFVLTSTIATIGKEPDGKPSNEDTAFDLKHAGHYGRSKYLAEQEVFKFCRKGLQAVILNPALVIGEGDYKPTPTGDIICKFLNRSYPGYFKTTWALVDVNDVARMHIAALTRGRIGERYILCDNRHYTMKEIFAILEEVSGVKAPKIRFPYPLLDAFVHAEEFLSIQVLKKKPLMPTEGIKYCKNSVIFDNSKAVRELGYTATPVKETLRRAVSWYRTHGYIKA